MKWCVRCASRQTLTRSVPTAAGDHGPAQPHAEAASLGRDRGGAGLPLHGGGAPDAGPAGEDPRLPPLRATAGDLRPGVLGGQLGGHPEEGETRRLTFVGNWLFNYHPAHLFTREIWVHKYTEFVVLHHKVYSVR